MAVSGEGIYKLQAGDFLWKCIFFCVWFRIVRQEIIALYILYSYILLCVFAKKESLGGKNQSVTHHVTFLGISKNFRNLQNRFFGEDISFWLSQNWLKICGWYWYRSGQKAAEFEPTKLEKVRGSYVVIQSRAVSFCVHLIWTADLDEILVWFLNLCTWVKCKEISRKLKYTTQF